MKPETENVAQDDRLIVWAFASFHVAIFIAALMLLLYLGGNLGQLLASLNTLVGLGIFGALWATTWFSTRQGWRWLQWNVTKAPNYGRLIGAGAFWGGVNAIMFLFIVVPLITTIAVTTTAGLAADFITVPIFTLVLGTPVAFVIGLLAGLVLALVDILLIVIVQWILSSTAKPQADSE